MTVKCSEKATNYLKHLAEKCLDRADKNKIKLNIPRYNDPNWENKMSELLESKKPFIPKGSSIYILYDNNGQKLYIGKSNKTYTRLRSHLVKCSGQTCSKFKEFIEYVKAGNRTIYFSVVTIEPRGLNAFCETYLQEKYPCKWVHRKG